MTNCMEKGGTLEIIGDYDIVVDDPTKHVPYAMFCTTLDAIKFMERLKKDKPNINWKMMHLSEWQKLYKGEKNATR